MSLLSENQLDPSLYGFKDDSDENVWTADPNIPDLSDYDALSDAILNFIATNGFQPGDLISQEELSNALFGDCMNGLNLLIDEIPEASLAHDENIYDEDLGDVIFAVTG